MLSPSRRGLSPTLVSEDAELESSVERSLAALTRDFVSRPNDRTALLAVCAALLGEAQVDELIGALEACANAAGLPDHDVAELSFRIAKGCTDAHARELCRLALDRDPVHVAALSLFEQVADASWTDELCARYQLFLEDAPLHGISPDLCALVQSKLAAAQRDTSADDLAFDDMHYLAGAFEGLRSAPKGGLPRGGSALETSAEWRAPSALGAHA